MSKKLVIAYVICVIPFFALAQNITGFWKGTLAMNRGCFPVNNIELQVTITADSIYGSSYHYLDVDNYIKKKFTGSYNVALKKFVVQEEVVTTYHIPSICKVCIKRYDLTYSRNVNQETLTGNWSGVLMGTLTDCESGPITLSRVRESAFKEIPEIEVDTGKIRLDFYDNGQIDGDSISVRVNNQMILSHQKLTAQPITIYVKIDPGNTYQEVEMIAENLGSIPPNTALLVITTGNKRYEVFLSSSDKKSAKVRFVYDKGKQMY